jgi:hypothetical protein
MDLRHHFPHCERSLCPSAARLAADLPKKYFAEMRQCFQFTFLKSVSDWKPLALLAGLIPKCGAHGRLECDVYEMNCRGTNAEIHCPARSFAFSAAPKTERPGRVTCRAVCLLPMPRLGAHRQPGTIY